MRSTAHELTPSCPLLGKAGPLRASRAQPTGVDDSAFIAVAGVFLLRGERTNAANADATDLKLVGYVPATWLESAHIAYGELTPSRGRAGWSEP